jgi:5-methyltetrahydropteroyltriglutamate--homocysteine methyltransferase
MKRSSERILTTHTGSLPRPDDLMTMLRAREAGEAHDAAALAERIRSSVAETVARQARAGIDIVNDGEMGKPSYATYVKDRLTGFEGGKSAPIFAADLGEFPSFTKRGGRESGVTVMKRPSCVGPIEYRGLDALRTDIANLKSAAAGAKIEETFMSAASPGVVSFFLSDNYYHDHERYIRAIAEAMRAEYEAIVEAGLILQVDCPDLAMSRHIQFKNLNLKEFRKTIELHIDALNHALASVPPERARLHLCWGNYEGPHHHDVPFADIADIVFKARPQGLSYEASNPRHEHEWETFKEIKPPDGKILIPGVIDSVTNFIEHPKLVAQRIANLANLVGRENVIAGTDCGFGTIAGVSRVDGEIAWAKLAAMAEGAKIATARLWSGRA